MSETGFDLKDALAALPVEYRDEDRLAIFRSVVAPGMPDGVVALVYHYAAALGLDPVRKEVLAVSTRRKDANDRWVTDYNIIVNIHGILKLMGRQPDYAGVRAACVYPNEKCVIHDDGRVEHSYEVTERPTKGDVLPLGAWATVTRVMHGKERLFTSWLPFYQCAQTTDEYRNGAKTGAKVLRATWATRADWMTEKCVLAATARKAYDHALGRVYAPEEFGAVSTPGGAIEVASDIPEPTLDGPEDAALLSAHVSNRPREVPVDPTVAAGLREVAERVGDLFSGEAGMDRAEAEAKVTAELVNEVKNVASLARAAFGDERNFVKETDSGTWLVDMDILAALKASGPILLDRADHAKLVTIRTLLHNERCAKEGRRG